MTITEDQLRYALKTIRLWLVPDERATIAYRGHILHPEDATTDILTAITHQQEKTSHPQ